MTKLEQLKQTITELLRDIETLERANIKKDIQVSNKNTYLIAIFLMFFLTNGLWFFCFLGLENG